MTTSFNLCQQAYLLRNVSVKTTLFVLEKETLAQENKLTIQVIPRRNCKRFSIQVYDFVAPGSDYSVSLPGYGAGNEAFPKLMY